MSPHRSFAARLCVSLLLAVFSASLAFAQGVKATPAPVVAASAAAEQVRFLAGGEVVQMRLEIFTAGGERLYNSDIKVGNLLDWNLQDQQGQRLADGAYRCLLTVNDMAGRTSQRQGVLLVQNGAAAWQTPEQAELLLRTVAPPDAAERPELLTTLSAGADLAAVALAHNGSEGRLLTGSGALSFRTGNFFASKDQEQMRLTPEGRLGLGVAEPQAKLDVAGLIRTGEGVVFPDGTVQSTAYVASGRTLSERAGLQRDAQGRLIEEKKASVAREDVGSRLNISGTGNTNRLTKWLNGPGEVVGDSGIHETAAGDLGIGTTTPGGVLDVLRSSPNPLIGRFWNTGAGPAQLRFVGGTGSTSQFLITDTAEWLTSIAVSNSIGMQFRVRDVGTTNTEAQLTSSPRLTILRNGNVGVGTTAPLHKLHVTSATGEALHGESDPSFGVFGQSTAGIGVTGTGSTGVSGLGGGAMGAGVKGESNNAGGYGVHGINMVSGGRAGFFEGAVRVNGNLHVEGTLSKMGGAFKIDHPLDPENKYLSHSFVESPDMMNIYNGVIRLDKKGQAIVTLPEWFEALNQDFRYQLTCIGGFAPVYVAREIKGNKFKIAGGRVGMKISWQVTGIRHDSFAKEHRIPTEEWKPLSERGTHLHRPGNLQKREAGARD